ncbi:FACTOR putative-RELATED [Salix purpurea]|uniref:FACTOR putative-RELATED n=1 Tax=Salix purpurea TaxID=77065 RepID=A0A9Q0P1R2_SALPP|nr:FACTOR putative-RELATED [Salix purpurea]
MTPVGFRFHPTVEEIIDYYLANKLEGRDYLVDDHIGEIDHLYQKDPWDIPDGKRINRKTKNGNWKVTGKPRDIKRGGTNEVIGTKRNVVFQQKCPASKKLVGTGWVIHEFQSRISPPDERALVLCKLKDRGDKSAADLPNDEGEASRFMGSDFDNNAAETHNREVRWSFPNCSFENVVFHVDDEDDINFSLPLQSQIHLQNSLVGEEDLHLADSFLVFPDEYGSENAAFSHPSTYTLQSGSENAAFSHPSTYILQSSSHAYEEPANLYGGHGDLKIARQLQMAPGDDILLMGASSVGSTTATRHEHIESMQSGGEVIPETRQPRPPAIMPETRQPRPPTPVMAPKFVERKDSRFQGMISRSFIPQAEVGIKESSGIAESDRKIVPVTNPKPRSNDSARKGRFIHHETTISSHRSCPPSVYLLNAVLGVVLFLIMLREALIVH